MQDKQSRRSDPEGSHHASKNASFKKARADQKTKLLQAYSEAAGVPLTDSEAGERSGVRDPHKRCSELVRDEMIAVSCKKTGEYGTPVRACALTAKGYAALDHSSKRQDSLF